jgi:hypothetical protein
MSTLIRYQDLITLHATTPDGARHAIEDVFMTDKDLRVAYLVVDIGGWFQDRKVMVSVDRFGAPDVADTEWPCQLEEAELEERPAPEDVVAAAERALPETMMVPAGERHSPRMIHRSVGEEAHPLRGAADPKGRVPEGAHLQSIGDLVHETKIEATDGPVGSLMDLIFDEGDWKARYLVVGTDIRAGLSRNQRVLETTAISDMDLGGRSIRVSVSGDDVHKALDLHEVDNVEGKWYNKVLAYYGLQT